MRNRMHPSSGCDSLGFVRILPTTLLVKPGYYKYNPSAPNFEYDLEYLYDKQIQWTPMDTASNPDNASTTQQSESEVPRELEHVVSLNGIDYVWIYRVIKPAPTDNTDASSQSVEPEK